MAISFRRKCPECGGARKVYANYADQMDHRLSPCSFCDGQGSVGDDVKAPEWCPCCGAGWASNGPGGILEYGCGTKVDYRLEFEHTLECKDRRIRVLEVELGIGTQKEKRDDGSE